MNNMNDYIRVGTDYFRETTIPMTGDDLKVLKKWNRQTIIDDYGKETLNDINKYDGFCFIPSHNNFQKMIKKHYNRYEPLSYTLNSDGNWEKIQQLLLHVFGEQYELGLDYLTILWNHPTQVLPILCLVSTERETGKTTFLTLLKLLFENNATLNTNEEFRSRFNSDWAGKLIIGIDEVLLDKKEDSERIKNLSTAKYYKSEAKGKDRAEGEFFGKFVMCSNNEDSFVKIDNYEVRYWVRKVPTLGSNSNPNLVDEVRSEIPSFANFLNTREIVAKKVSRMWFSKEQIHTDALDVLMFGNRTNIEKELEELLKDEFSFFEVDTLCYTTKNLFDMLKNRGIHASSSYIATILKGKYNLTNEKNSSYKYYRSEIYNAANPVASGFTNESGRYYEFKRSVFGI
jgi:hypothetical protein